MSTISLIDSNTLELVDTNTLLTDIFTFTPPARSTVPPVLPFGDPDQSTEGWLLMRFFRSRPEGINVYVLSDDTVTEDDPDGETVYWAQGDTGRTTEPYVAQAFYGGHDDYNIDSATADLLTGAGYTVVP